MFRFKNLFLLILILFSLIVSTSSAQAENLANRLAGKILLQVEANGEAWYVSPENNERYFLGRPADAFQIMRDLGLGVSNNDFDAWQGIAPDRLKGKIVLKVEDKGKAYYISPDDNKLHYLGRPADAFQVMRGEGLGITNLSLDTISVAEGYDIGVVEVSPPALPEPLIVEKDEIIEEEVEEEIVVSGTSVSGEISENTIWTLANSPYLITDTLEIVKNKKLTIEPGVEIKIDNGDGTVDLGGVSIIVNGTIEAKGTIDNKISFMSSGSTGEKGDWGAIEVINGGQLKFEYVSITDASTGIYAVNAFNIEILNSVIKNNIIGIYLNSSATVDYNLIDNNNVGVVMANNTVSIRDTGDYKNFNWLVQFYNNIVSNNIGEDNVSAGIKFINIESSSYQFNLERNEISANTNGLLYKNTSVYSGINVKNNNIINNINYAIYLDAIGSDVIMEDNWWGNDVSSNIDEMIFDYYDVGYDLAQVDYRPFKMAPVDIN